MKKKKDEKNKEILLIKEDASEKMSNPPAVCGLYVTLLLDLLLCSFYHRTTHTCNLDRQLVCPYMNETGSSASSPLLYF